jgi:hypothetical protein
LCPQSIKVKKIDGGGEDEDVTWYYLRKLSTFKEYA